MTIVIEDGSVVLDANSYITVSGVDSYASDYGYSSWGTTTDTIKEQSLLRGMRYIEGLSFKGCRSTEDQSLAFPRSDLYDRDDYLIDSTTVPAKVISAVCEAAIMSLPTSDIDLQPSRSKDDYRKKIEIAGIVVEEWFADSTGIITNSKIIQDLLVGYLNSRFIVEVLRG